MSVVLSPLFNGWQGFSIGGVPLVGGLLHTYLAGTTTPAATYTDNTGSTPNANPIQLDGAGLLPNEIWLTPGVAYKYVLTDSLGLSPRTYDNITGPDLTGASSALGVLLANTTNVAQGDALVGVHRTEANAVGRTLHFYVQHSKLLVANYTDPTADTASQVATALANAISDAKAYGKVLEFDPGATYTTNAETALGGSNGLTGLRFWGNGCTIYRSSGAGPVMSFDSGGDTSRNDANEVVGFVLRGNAASTYGWSERGLIRSKVHDIRVVDVANAGFRLRWAVLNHYLRPIVSTNVDTFIVLPTEGIIVDQTAAGTSFGSAANTFEDFAFEGLSDTGIELVAGGNNVFLGGSSEANATGLVVRAASQGDNFHGVDFEANTVCDVSHYGKRTGFTDCNFASGGSALSVLLNSGSLSPIFRGGYLRSVKCDTGSSGARFYGVSFNNNGALGIQGLVTDYRSYGSVLVDSSWLVTGQVPDGLGTGGFTGTLTGCTTSPTATIFARVAGDVVTLDIPALSATSNTTAATITGMPAAFRPTGLRSGIGIAINNGTDTVSRFEIDAAGVITLRNGASAVFTNVGAKGVQACTIVYKI